MKSLIYDFETLGTNHAESAVVSLAALVFDSSNFNPGYSYDELLTNTISVKFDVADQVRNYGKKIDPDTLKWWGEQSAEAQKQLKPSTDDMSIGNLKSWITSVANPDTIDRVYTRGNTFDPMFLATICGGDPYPHWKLRDTRSVIEGMMLFNTSMKNGFMVPGLEDKFVPHDAKHDVAMDVMRMQFLMQEML
jgi:hypothetical protein